MTLWFQAILAVVLVLLCIFLFFLFKQLQRTAVAIQHLAESVKNDLQQVAADVHSLRVRADKLLDITTDNLELSFSVNSLISRTVRTMHAFLDKNNLSWLEVLFTNIKFINKFINRSKI
jgi:hypothetical protein